MARRPNGTPYRNVTVRLAEATFQQLSGEALAHDLPVSSYLRDLLEAYAPGTERSVDFQELAKKLAATPISLDDPHP